MYAIPRCCAGQGLNPQPWTLATCLCMCAAGPRAGQAQYQCVCMRVACFVSNFFILGQTLPFSDSRGHQSVCKGVLGLCATHRVVHSRLLSHAAVPVCTGVCVLPECIYRALECGVPDRYKCFAHLCQSYDKRQRGLLSGMHNPFRRRFAMYALCGCRDVPYVLWAVPDCALQYPAWAEWWRE